MPEDEWHSYCIGEVVGGEVRMYDEPVDNGPITPITPQEFIRGTERLKTALGASAEEAVRLGDGIRAMADSVAALGIGSVVKAAADAEAERVYRAREDGDRG
jgi:hypothetical protein